MPDLPQRATRERELAAAIALIFADWRKYALRNPDAVFSFRADELRQAMAPVLAKTATQAAGGMKINPSSVTSDIDQWAHDRATLVANELAQKLTDELRQAKQKADDENFSFAALIAILFGRVRIIRTGITEITRAISAGEWIAIAWIRRELEAKPDKTKPGTSAVDAEDEPGGGPGRLRLPKDAIWYTSKKENVCKVCAPLHKKNRAVWVNFFPLGPPAHVRCQCYLEYEE